MNAVEPDARTLAAYDRSAAALTESIMSHLYSKIYIYIFHSQLPFKIIFNKYEMNLRKNPPLPQIRLEAQTGTVFMIYST